MVLSLLMAAAVAAQATNENPHQEGSKEKGYDFIVLPVPNFNTDLGFGLGVTGGAYIYSPGYKPYRHAFAAQVFYTTSGVQNDWVRYDGPDLLPHTRVEFRLDFQHQPFSPYYGPGNLTAPGVSAVPSKTNHKFFSYDRRGYGGWLRLTFTAFDKESALGPLRPYVGYGIQRYDVRTFESTLLPQESPKGVDGGWGARLFTGVLWDERDDQNDPSSGGVEELSLQLFLRPLGSTFNYGQLTFSTRRFFLLAPRLVFSFRFILDHLFGDVPFWAWSSAGGTNPFGGIGGVSSVRGVTLNRYSGDTKAIVNNELRWLPIDFNILHVTTKFGFSAFLDTGRVWQPDIPNGSFWEWHLGTGGGLRIVRREAVLRADYAVWIATGHRALYVTFGNPF